MRKILEPMQIEHKHWEMIFQKKTPKREARDEKILKMEHSFEPMLGERKWICLAPTREQKTKENKRF